MKYLRYLLYFLLFSFSVEAEIDLTKKLPMDNKYIEASLMPKK